MYKFEQIFLKTELRLFLFLAYVISLLYVFLVWQDPHFTIWHSLFRVVRVHLLFTLLFSIVSFWPPIFMVLSDADNGHIFTNRKL
jgi:hypothetical protein